MNKELIQKALGMTEAGNILVQPEIDKVIADLLMYNNPLRQNLPRKKGTGKAYIFNRRRPIGASNAAAWVDDTDNLASIESTGTYEQVSLDYKTIATRGKVTRKLQAVGQSYIDVLAEEIEAKTKEFQIVEEEAYVNANAFATEAKKPLGIIKQLRDAGRIFGANVDGGTDLTLEQLDYLIDQCKGTPSALIMSKKTRRILQSMLQVYQRWIDRVEVNGGFKLLSYNGIPIYVSDAVKDNYYWNGSALVGATDVAEKQSSIIIAVNFDECFVAELTPVKFEMLAKTTTQYGEFEIYSDQTLVVKDYMTCAILAGVKG